jgi:hypothetical protein
VDILDLHRVQHESELAQIVLGFFEELLGEGELVLVDLFWRETRQDPAQVAFEHILGDPDHVIPVLVEEAFDGGSQGGLMTGNLDVGDPLDVQRDAALGVGTVAVHVDDHVGEVEAIDLFDEGDTPAAPTLDDPVAAIAIGRRSAAATEDEDLVGLADVEEVACESDDSDRRC